MEGASFIGIAWNNGRHHASGAGYGIKLSARDRDAYMRRDWGAIDLHLEGVGQPISVNVAKDSFWNDNCRELISRDIGRWLIKQGSAPWPSGLPPRVRLAKRGARSFDVFVL